MRKAIKQPAKAKVDRGFLVSRVRSGNSLSQEPWLSADVEALRVNDDELLSAVTVELSISSRQPDEWVSQFLDAEELAVTHGDTLRQIRMFSPFVERNSLARMLLYSWHTCLGSEFSTVREEIAELRRVAESMGFVKPSDIKLRTGRRSGSFKAKNKKRLEKFMELQVQYPNLSADNIALKVATLEIRPGSSNAKKQSVQSEVRKFFQRQKLVARKQRNR
jgi:hypothetical protein